jgi:hypothetical protein
MRGRAIHVLAGSHAERRGAAVLRPQRHGREGVSDEDWRRFVDEEVTPRFPDGFSVADVDGQYRNAAGTIVRERSKELIVISRGSADDTMKLNAIHDAYKRRFNQESVLLTTFPICAGF